MSVSKASYFHTNNLLENKNINSKPSKNIFEIGEKFFGSYHKDVLRAFRFAAEWTQLLVNDLEFFEPLKSFTSALKVGEEALCFPDIGKTTSKIVSNSIKLIKHGDTSVISDIRTSSFEGIWNFSKVINWLEKTKVVFFTTRFATNLTAIGGVSFVLSSTEKSINDAMTLLKLNNKTKNLNEDFLKNEKMYQVLRLAKNIGSIVFGIFITLNVILGTISPLAFLVIGTIILISSISSTILKESNQLRLT